MEEELYQMNLFEAIYDKPSLPSHIRIIEFFAGIGAQAKALEILKVDFEHWRTCEWSWQSITAYNAIHMGGKVEDTSDLTYEEVLQRINGVSADYNKPMTETELRRKGETWARNLLGRMITNHNVCPNISQLKGKDLGIVERERAIPTSSPIHSRVKTFPMQGLCRAWKKEAEHVLACCGRSKESSLNAKNSIHFRKSLLWRTSLE